MGRSAQRAEAQGNKSCENSRLITAKYFGALLFNIIFHAYVFKNKEEVMCMSHIFVTFSFYLIEFFMPLEEP